MNISNLYLNKNITYISVFTCSLGLSSNAMGFSFAGVNTINVDTGVFIGGMDPTLTTAPRWDAVDFTLGTGDIFDDGWSLVDGISYNYESDFINQFTWDVDPTQVQIDAAIDAAFDVWAANSPLSFNKVDTAVSLPGVTENRVVGAEIDLFGTDNLGALGSTGLAVIKQTDGGNVTLTSGVEDYSSSTIVSSDIELNNVFNNGDDWTLANWQLVLTHEIGHAIGLGDVDVKNFYDTNNTLNDIMAISILDPNNTANLAIRVGSDFTTTDILMETDANAALLGALAFDDLAGRSFLYPAPIPASVWLFGSGLMGLIGISRRKIT